VKKNVLEQKNEEKKKKNENEKMKIKLQAKVVDKSIKKEHKFSNAFILSWILSNVNVEITDNSSQLLQFSYGVLLGSIVILFCLLNITGYIITNYLLEKVDLENKYPTIWKYLNRFIKISLFYICIDILICLYLLSLIVYYSLVIVSQHQSPV
jgi:hypothetical protein